MRRAEKEEKKEIARNYGVAVFCTTRSINAWRVGRHIIIAATPAGEKLLNPSTLLYRAPRRKCAATRGIVKRAATFVAFGCTLFVRRDLKRGLTKARTTLDPRKCLSLLDLQDFPSFVYYFYSVFNKILILMDDERKRSFQFLVRDCKI